MGPELEDMQGQWKVGMDGFLANKEADLAGW